MIQDFDFSQKKREEEGKFSVGDIVFCWHRGYDPNRKANEDDWGVAKTPNGYLFVVCDGMGGHAGGQEASRIAVETLLNFFNVNYFDVPAENVLQNALIEANRAVFNAMLENPALKGMGTTACVLFLPLRDKDDTAHFAHVGDSRIYIYAKKDKDKKRRLYRLTKDHSLVQTLVDKGELSDEEMETDSRKNIIMKALGIKEEMQPALNTAKPVNGDIFLICSDGLTGMVRDADIEAILARTDISLQEKGEKLKNRALSNGGTGTDNITLQLIQISESNNSQSVFTDYNPKPQQHKQHLQDYRKTEKMSEKAGLMAKYSFLSRKVIAMTGSFLILIILVFFGIKQCTPNEYRSVSKQIKQQENDSIKTHDQLTNTEAILSAKRAGNFDDTTAIIHKRDSLLNRKNDINDTLKYNRYRANSLLKHK